MKIEKPIFIAGIGSSGTTLLHRLLCEHPNVAWLSRIAKPRPGMSKNNRAFMKAIDYPILGRYLKKIIKPTECYEFWERYAPGFGSTFRDLVSEDVTIRTRTRLLLATSEQLTSKRNRFLAKITGWPRLGYLHEIFNDAKFIHISRDGRAVVNSRLHGSWWHGWQGPHNWNRPPLTSEENEVWEQYDRSFVALASIEWRMLMDAFETARNGTKNAECLQIRYEDLCSDLLSSLQRIVEFCELSWTSDFESVVGTYRVISANRKWMENLNEGQHHIMKCILRDCLERYGYTE